MPFALGAFISILGTTVNQDFLVTHKNTLKCLYKRDGVFCSKQSVNRQVQYTPLNPQPSDVVTFHRYYTKLKGDEQFKKRISTITSAPDGLSYVKRKALVEYCGTKTTTNQPHGNSKAGKSYRRTDPHILRKGLTLIGPKNAKDVVTEMALDDSLNAPKSSRQLQDKIYRDQRKKQTHPTNSNVADEVLSVISQIHDHPFIQEVIISKGKQPITILYSEDQMADMKRNCIGDNSSVIGVDRTFNLGKVFVTTMTYKNRSVTCRKTGQYPIFLGPLCLHWDAERSTYHKFFSHVKDKLGSDNLTIGTDDEKAMRNALSANFPGATFLLCTKHLKDNIRHYLQKHGCSEKDRIRLLNLIFNDIDGLVFSENDWDFTQREDDLSSYFDKYPKFKSYYETYLHSKLKDYVYLPLKKNLITKLWTNNNAESINNRLKQVAEWKQHKIPELIDRLQTVSKAQMLDLRHSLYGSGNYDLHGCMASFLIDANMWDVKSKCEKMKYFQNFLKRTVVSDDSRSKFIHAVGGNFKIYRPKTTAGRKPGQRKRPKAERASVTGWFKENNTYPLCKLVCKRQI